MDNFNMTLVEVAEAVKSRKLSAVEVTKHCLERAEETRDLNAFSVIDEGYALDQAAQIDAKVARGEKIGVLAGVPIGVKDNMSTEVLPTTCASASIGKNIIERVDCAAVRQIRKNGGIVLGKMNMDEFAMGFSSTNTVFGEVSNPFDKDYSAGGSSGGSAVAVAVGSVLGSLGSDTGGSIRQPAANCGICGLKPTFDAVSRDGMIPLSETLDHLGCLTRTARDNALLFSALSNHTDFSHCFEKGVHRGLKVAFLDDFGNAFIDDDVFRLFNDAVKVFASEMNVSGLNFSFSKEIAETYTLLCSTEAVASFRNFNEKYHDSIRLDKCGKEVNKRIKFGLEVLADGGKTALEKAAKVRSEVRAFIDETFKSCDVILSPTTLLPAQRKDATVDNEKGFTSDLFSIVCNLTGIPALSVPCGFDRRGLPIGLMIMARHNREEDIFRAAGFFLDEQSERSRLSAVL